MKKMYIIIIVCVLVIISFIPLWPKPVKSGVIKVNTWTKIQLVLGLIKVD